MPRVQRVILVFSVVAFAALFSSHLDAEDKATEVATRQVREKAPPALLVVGDKCTTARSIWCPDSYRPKCPPAICPPSYCGGCDCYRAKCPPYICPPLYCGTCDCYSAKCPPCVKVPCWFPSFYKCPPADCGVIPTKKLGIFK